MTLNEKAAYLKGLMEGLSLDETKPETKVLLAMADMLDDIAASYADLENELNDAKDYLDELDDDLADVEDIVYDDEDDDEYDDDEDDEDDEYEDDDEGEMFVEVECPFCGETVYFDETVDPENIICPACNNSFSCICDECDGDCEDCEGDCAELAAIDGDEE